jgi:hypothetical protein
MTGLIAVGVGVAGIALVPLIHWYVLPNVELIPLATDTTVISTGNATYFDSNTLSSKGPVQLTVTTHVVSDVAAGKASGDAVWNISTTVDTPDTLKFHDPRYSLEWTLERWVADRRTGLPVHCCGEKPAFEGNVYVKFPFGVAKGEYDLWNPRAKHAYPVHFTRVETVAGHQLYRFDGPVPATDVATLQVPGALVGLPSSAGMVTVHQYYRDSDSEVLVDPLSGVVVSATQHPTVTFRLPDSDQDRFTVLSATFASEPASTRAVLDLVDSTDRELTLIQDTVPTVALWAGSALLLLGAVQLVFALRAARRAER